ncbi:glycosyltransferase family 2 protein [Arthrospira platensis]|uniref:glycosyltransferase family 2 protein n=1 Tax=Limnospira TaxID=2596745 RepID=UPI0001C38845|nr:glycosyl transferase [Arthrospira platensis YZ]KDR57554.1 glycosyl transferase [Arthrospira platensis str. Paraca]MBD2574403.1 glycosyltransferase [Arthrospira platensis FACHB-971]MBD2711404.1 glycosyltransferase [Arthrospira platensis FACHB-835]MDT9297175.1 glycosyltransferase [Arthrospira platensis PCC 7345]MDT9312709.1 glycosyltransferase [Limnospira sp. Paracas R14]QQW31715.1 glycosyltransferase [Arthrospira sp. PCC 9108]
MIYWIVVNYHSTDLIETLIQSIANSSSIDHQIIIVNNSPQDKSIWKLHRKQVIILDASHNLGFGRACNLGLQWVYQRDNNAWVWLINPDVVIPEHTPNQVLAVVTENPQFSILGTLVYQPDGRVWFGGGEFIQETGLIVQQQHLPASVSDCISTTWVTACSLLINLQKFGNCPQFDEDYFLYYEDFDLCLRYSKLGHQIGMTPHIGVIHHPSSITGRNPHLKLKHSIYSYLLSLEKHAKGLACWYRILRITVVSLITFPWYPQASLSKLIGVLDYVKSRFWG